MPARLGPLDQLPALVVTDLTRQYGVGARKLVGR